METVKILEKRERLAWDYDEDADVLYVSVGRPRKAIGVDIGQGVVIRYDEAKKEVDVVARFQAALGEHPCEWFMRISGDSPLIDVSLVRAMIGLSDRDHDVVSNVVLPQFQDLFANKITPEKYIDNMATKSAAFWAGQK